LILINKYINKYKTNSNTAYRYSVQGDSVSPNHTDKPGVKFSPVNSIVAAAPPPSTYTKT